MKTFLLYLVLPVTIPVRVPGCILVLYGYSNILVILGPKVKETRNRIGSPTKVSQPFDQCKFIFVFNLREIERFYFSFTKNEFFIRIAVSSKACSAALLINKSQ